MTLRDFLKIVRVRWITISAAVVLALLASVAISLLTTPQYQASTRLYVATASGKSLSDLYQGSLLSQERVLSYSELLKGETVAQRTISKLGLSMTPKELQQKIKVNAKPDTVLIDVDVIDASPVRARDLANMLSDEFVLMVQELETPKDGSTPSARVIVEQTASVPDAPVIPKTGRNIAFGLIIGALFGVGLALLRDRLDSTVKSRDSFEAVTGAGLVGTIPMDKERQKQAPISFDRDQSAIAEEFRKLRTNLQFLSVDNPPRAIVIASSLPGEGKSTTAINLALVLAEGNHDVVLVDGDLRRPSLDNYLNGIVGKVGFSTVLSGAATLEDALQQTEFPRLTVLASGAVPPNPSELLGSMAAHNVLAELRRQFDYVIVDSSPLLAVTDAAILASASDGVLIISRFGQTKREQLEHGVKNILDVGATVLGAVFTMTSIRAGSPYSYNYGSYGSESPAEKIDSVADLPRDLRA